MKKCSIFRAAAESPPPDTGRKFNVKKTIRRRSGRALFVLSTFNLRPVAEGNIKPLDETHFVAVRGLIH